MIGAAGSSRTNLLRCFKPALNHLSYSGKWWSCRELNPQSLLARQARDSSHNPKLVPSLRIELSQPAL